MAAAQPTSPESFLLDLLRPDRVRHHARRLGFVLRIGPIKLLPFVLAVVLTPSGRGEQPIAAMRRAFERRTGYLPARSSFWERLSPAFGRLVRWMLDDVVDRSWDATPKPPGFLSSFKSPPTNPDRGWLPPLAARPRLRYPDAGPLAQVAGPRPTQAVPGLTRNRRCRPLSGWLGAGIPGACRPGTERGVSGGSTRCPPPRGAGGGRASAGRGGPGRGTRRAG